MGIVVITGGSSGIGLSAVKKFLESGHDVANFDIREPSDKNSADYFQTDISNFEQLLNAMKLVQNKYGSLDFLVNAAGIFDNFTPCGQTSDQLWNRVLNINLNGTFYACRAALEIMLPAQCGSIVNISSVAGLTAQGGGAAYCASKHAVMGLTRSIAKYYGQYGIKANAICPGIINTSLLQTSKETLVATNDWFWGEDKRPRINAKEKVPMGRQGTPVEIAESIYFLATAGYVNGHIMVVDGGLMS